MLPALVLAALLCDSTAAALLFGVMAIVFGAVADHCGLDAALQRGVR